MRLSSRSRMVFFGSTAMRVVSATGALRWAYASLTSVGRQLFVSRGRAGAAATAKRSAFYDLPQDERIAMTQAVIDQGRTMVERWSVLDDAEAAPWNARAALAALWLSDEPAVADLGCGTMTLERHLRHDQAYVPMDVFGRDARTVVCDFNVDEPPETAAQAVACLGLIEYLHDPRRFLTQLRKQYARGVVSYCITDAPQAPTNRREHAWVNDFDRNGFLLLLEDCGWIVAEQRVVDRLQVLFRLTSEPSRRL